MSRKRMLLSDSGGGSVVDLESGAEREPSQFASSE
jgi:hypothetical protein